MSSTPISSSLIPDMLMITVKLQNQSTCEKEKKKKKKKKMPRPGPRPYECVRRAWHSDRHQPIRGSLIQDIFRLVNEAHGSTTKKNKEWQEKLPVVVLKAEEIMYSKANSEAEYIEPKTLWDRTNDAINTIIRRDESMETGELLQPCIEAALNLGLHTEKSLEEPTELQSELLP
ncbi:hypothetical protein OIU84_009867 [Salix udensis]|uniref:Uncharacterized protein n=1 Tax=Salix udensis TaxID=889485 RepID=A0AAD6JJI1_9ROSI|nr:hypothetical protein OIU84_009867 [Salix udensis]